MPFLTEEIWQKVPHDDALKSIMETSWPEVMAECISDEIEADMTAIMETIKTVRNMRAEVGAAPSKKSELILSFTDESLRAVFTENQSYLDKLASSDPITILPAGADKPENAMAGMVNGVEVFLPLKGLIDVDKETARLTKELEKLDKEISRLAKKLGNEGFLAKAPADVVAGEKEKLAGYEEKKKSVEGRMQDLAKLK
jgi:valyl-tRNA synthetase